MRSISIIIPVYNVEQYLHQCIESILISTFENYELILIDDGSTDNSGKICDEFLERDERIRVYHIKNGGVSRARNIGIKNACTPWITFIDADDYISPTFLESLFHSVIEHPDIDFASTGYTNYSDGKIESIEISYSPYYGSDMNYLCSIYRGRVYGKLFKREYLQEVQFDEKISSAEDLVFVTDYLASIGKSQRGRAKFILLNEVGYFYRCDNTQSITHTSSLITYEEQLHFFQHLYNSINDLITTYTIDEKHSSLRLIQAADNMFFSLSVLYENRANTRQERLHHLRTDFSKDQFLLLKYVSGKRNRIVCTLLRLRLYTLFDIIFKRRFQ